MIRNTFSLLNILLLIVTIGCTRLSPETTPKEDKKMEALNIPPTFDWQTSRNVELTVTSDIPFVISITSTDEKVVYYKGFHSTYPEPSVIILNIPNYVNSLLFNKSPLYIASSTHITVTYHLPPQTSGISMQAAPAPPEGLLASWNFDENSGSTSNDLLGIRNGTNTQTARVPGISGSALEFDGTTSNVLIPNGGNFNPTGDKISLSLWFRQSEVGAGGALIFQNVKYILRMDAQGRVGFALYIPLYKDIVMTYADRILDTDWHHVAATYDGSTMKLYIDGVLKASGPNSGALNTSTADVIIGKQATLNPFKGTIDEVQVYGKSLTESEVSQIYTTTPHPGNGSSDLISSWLMDDNSGTTVKDYTSTNNGTLTGAVWGTGVKGSCLEFNGTNSNVSIPTATNLNPVNEITVMTWVKAQEYRSSKIFQKGDWDGHGIGLDLWNGWQCGIRMEENTGNSLEWGLGRPILNEWYHIAMTYDGAILKMYVNGQLKNSKAVTGRLKVNTRSVSLGSDNGVQKFFKGSIDEVLLFGKALTQTEIQANFSERNNSPDQDGDGVANADDSYPMDPARVFNNYFPAEGYGSLAFEDLWPSKGDFDFNDLVIDYQFTIVTNAANKVTEVLCNFVIRAIGAGFSNGFGFQLPGTAVKASDIQVEGSVLSGSYITLNPNGTEANQNNITIIAFDNANSIMSAPSGFGVNVVPGNPYVTPVKVVVNIGLTPGVYGINDLKLHNFNPFLIINHERGKEVHLANYPPTSLVNQSYFGTNQDRSDPAAGKYYKSAENLPWAINIASTYSYTIEGVQITSAHLKFAEWAESAGVKYPDWYLNNAGYREIKNIY